MPFTAQELAPYWKASEGLSPKEREVLGLIADGKEMKEIARDLGISVRTVDARRGHIHNKLGTTGASELTAVSVHLVYGKQPAAIKEPERSGNRLSPAASICVPQG